MNITDTLVLIKGAGDLASGVAARLFRCGFPVAMTELPHPLMVRRTVAFGEAVYEGEVVVEDITARRVEDVSAARLALQARVIPILVDPDAARSDILNNDLALVDGFAERDGAADHEGMGQFGHGDGEPAAKEPRGDAGS